DRDHFHFVHCAVALHAHRQRTSREIVDGSGSRRRGRCGSCSRAGAGRRQGERQRLETSMTGPEIGASATVDLVVRESDCANALRLSDDPRDQFPAVFATTRMIALMELAGSRLLHPLLQSGEMSVGAHVDVSHTAATPIGAKVTATATYR